MTPQLRQLLTAADDARRGGDPARSTALFEQALAIAPDQPIALNALGMQALGRDDDRAATLFTRAAAADPRAIPLWMNLATAHRHRGDAAAERSALDAAVGIDQRHLMANVRLAEWHERAGEEDAAGFRWSGVATVIQSLPERAADLNELLARAQDRIAARGAAVSAQIDAALAPLRDGVDGSTRRRFDACVDAMLGRRTIYAPAPHGLHFPFLPADEFFPREHFMPWIAGLEAATTAIREELEALLRDPDSGFAPYVSMLPGTPANLWTPLDRSDSWSARYLWRYGIRDDAMCARCPATAAAIEAVPRAELPGRAPTAFFSVLKPGAHLPPHTGTSNVRSILHLPLIVPDDCGFRVGGETREWRVGEAFVFDDTIEHEAWNRSDAVRAVLILDVWNPHLTTSEQAMVQQLFATMGAQLSSAGAFD